MTTRDQAMTEATENQWCAWCQKPMPGQDPLYPFCSPACHDADWEAHVKEQSDPQMKLLI